MTIKAKNVEDYIEQLNGEKKIALLKLKEIIVRNLPSGFEETILYNMISYIVPHSIYPAGYHCNPKDPLPFMSIAAQKNFIALYHMGLMANHTILQWFQNEYPKHCTHKLDMGKCCIRFKNLNTIPYVLIGELCTKISVSDWMHLYQTHIKKS